LIIGRGRSWDVEDREQRALELASRPRLAVLSVVGEDSSDRLGPSSSRVSRQEGIEGHRAREPLVFRLVERAPRHRLVAHCATE
jgi:hypothetical protein